MIFPSHSTIEQQTEIKKITFLFLFFFGFLFATHFLFKFSCISFGNINFFLLINWFVKFCRNLLKWCSNWSYYFKSQMPSIQLISYDIRCIRCRFLFKDIYHKQILFGLYWFRKNGKLDQWRRNLIFSTQKLFYALCIYLRMEWNELLFVWCDK